VVGPGQRPDRVILGGAVTEHPPGLGPAVGNRQQVTFGLYGANWPAGFFFQTQACRE
jgi:hypothetical protein